MMHQMKLIPPLFQKPLAYYFNIMMIKNVNKDMKKREKEQDKFEGKTK